jgi:acetyl esterase/lipase
MKPRSSLLPSHLIFQVFLGFLVAAFTCATTAAQTPRRMPLWPGTAPHADAARGGTNAFIAVFRPADSNGAAVIICPGGGYGGLVTGAEGTGIAQWLNQHRITGIVLEYRLPHGNSEVPLLDAQRALRTARAFAPDWGIDPQRIGIAGFSAGGHLASTVATHFDEGDASSSDPVARAGCRPDFAILVYPVITLGERGHAGSRLNLMGPNPTAETILRFSNEQQVTPRTSPSYLAHAVDDRAVSIENSRLFHAALNAKGVPTEILELPSGDHGLNGYKGPMWDAWQSGALRWLAQLKLIPQADATAATPVPVFPKFEDLNRGPLQIRPLTATSEFIFSLYGAPSDLESVRQLVEVMRERDLGNGFDPGPGAESHNRPVFEFLAKNRWPVVLYSGGEMQIRGGRAVFGREHEAVLAPMDQADVFTAYQIGEWGYYFHNLAPRESWWRDVYGSDFERFKHLMKPAGLAGYDRRPTSRQECYDVLKQYFQSRCRDLLGRTISVTGHSHYEAYVAAWGSRCVGLELGENIAFTQSKLAFARGASRGWAKPWSVQVSPWFHGACTTAGPLRQQAGGARGLDAGHSLSFYQRLWLHSWFAGAAMVTPENSIAIFFEKQESPWTLTSHGERAIETFRLMKAHDRGIPFTPVAVVLDRLAGYNGYMDKPWGILEPTPGDRELRDLFDHQIFPGSDHIHTRPDPANPEAAYLRPTPFGEIFDVHLTSVPPEVLPKYPVILLAGDITFDDPFLSELEKALRRGSRVLVSPRHRDALGNDFARLQRQGEVEVLEPWTHPKTGRPTAISDDRLRSLSRQHTPIEVTGDPVQYQINRTATGWVVELIHNGGVAKTPNEPATIDPTAIARVRLRPKFDAAFVKEWRSGKTYSGTAPIMQELQPGTVEFVEFQEAGH